MPIRTILCAVAGVLLGQAAVAGIIGQSSQTKETVCERLDVVDPSPDTVGILYEIVKDQNGKMLSKTAIGTCKGHPWALVVPSRPVRGVAGRIEWAVLQEFKPVNKQLTTQIRRTGKVPAGLPLVTKQDMERKLNEAARRLRAD